MMPAEFTSREHRQLEQKFFALGDTARFAIVKQLATGPKTAGELAAPFNISRPAISRHLRVLREAGIARAEVRGREWWYSLEPAAFRDMHDWTEAIGEMWTQALDNFKAYVESDQDKDNE